MNKKDYYVEQYKQYHENPNMYPGDSINFDTKFIKKLISQFAATSLLDFGCGKGYQYSKERVHEKYFNCILPSLYDPGVPEYSQMPEGKFDGVFTCDVMEHIPEEYIDEVLTQIYSKANKFVFISTSDIPAHAVLPNGENAHVTLKPCSWWIEKIKPFSEIPTMFVIRGNDRYYCQIFNGELVSQNAF